MKNNIPQNNNTKNPLCNRFDIFYRGITINNRTNRGEEGLSVKKRICYVLAISMLSTNMALAASNYNYQPAQTQAVYQYQYVQQPLAPVSNYNATPQLSGHVVTVPAGTKVDIVVTSPISSEYTTLGQNVSVALGSDFYYNNKLVAPAGSTVSGIVIESSKAKRGSMNGKLAIRFTQILTPYGVAIPISGIIATTDNTGVLIGGTKADVAKDYAKDLAVGSAGGAVTGVVFGALSGGSVGRGAALGTAVGAGAGLVKSVWDKGDDVILPANSKLDIVLTQPITVNPASYDYGD